MEHIALYRKYRPKDFSSIYGQKIITQTLTNAINTKCINHAYIFAGNKGCGKTSLAKIFAKAINCTNCQDGNPCNECAKCLAINNNSCSDILELDAASNSGINEIRAIIESIGYLPNQLKYKVYIIDEAHMLTNNSWNALLKTLEEPPKHAVIIFATTEFHKIPATIVSRCQRYDICKISRDLLNQLIVNVAFQEGIQVEQDAINTISTLANGSARDALSILDQMSSFCSNDIKNAALNEMFGLVNIDHKLTFVNNLTSGDIGVCLEQIDNYSQHGVNFLILSSDILQILMDKMIYLQTKNANLLQILPLEKCDFLKCNDTKILLELINVFHDNYMRLKTTDQPKFIFEYTCISAIEKIHATQTHKPVMNQQTSQPSQAQTPPAATATKLWGDKITPKVTPITKLDLEPTKPVENQAQVETVPMISDALFITKERVGEVQVKTVLKQTPTRELPPTTPIVEHPKHFTPTSNLETTNEETADVVQESLLVNEPVQAEPEIYNDEYRDRFYCVAANRLRNEKDKHNQILDNLKELATTFDPEINRFLIAKKFILVSDNGAVLLFSNKSQVIRFNKICNQPNFLQFFTNSFGKQQEVIGIDEETALHWKIEFQKLAQKTFDDVKILNTFVDEKKTKLLDILNLRDLDDNDNEDETHQEGE